jgi:hypothetical protein
MKKGYKMTPEQIENIKRGTKIGMNKPGVKQNMSYKKQGKKPWNDGKTKEECPQLANPHNEEWNEKISIEVSKAQEGVTWES